MRRQVVLACIAAGVVSLPGGWAVAQNSVDALDAELKEAESTHADASTQAMADFFTQLDAAMASPDAAVTLYQQAGGEMPTPLPVITEHVSETETEKEARVAQDQANLSRLGTVLQLHCGVMHYAALYVTKPEQKGFQDAWVAWLKQAAQVYPQLAVPAPPPDPAAGPAKPKRDDDRRARAVTPPPPFSPAELKIKTMRESIIGKYLGFAGWGDKDQGLWTVGDLPKLYQTNVLEPLRAKPTAETLAAWDAYIAMRNADEPDNLKWNQSIYPPLQFDRASDDYAIAPSTEKLEGLVNIVKMNPTHAQADEWISRLHRMIQDYRAKHGGAAAPAVTVGGTPAPAATTDPNVTVSTSVQGDMTIITTHTNTPPANPADSAAH